MFHFSVYIVWLGALVQLLGSAAYIKDTLQGKTKPNRVTWFFWSVAPLIGAAAALADGVRWAVLPVAAVGFVPLLILLASFINKQAYWKLNKFDYICGCFAALSLILWFITSQPVIAIALAIITDAFAAIPTITKAWTNPETETRAEYAATIFSSITGLLASKIWNFSEISFLIYLIIINSLVLLAIYQNKIKKLLLFLVN